MNNVVFLKTVENVRKQRDVKLVTTNKRRNYLVSETNYHTTKQFSKDLLVIEIKKIKVKLTKLGYLGLSKLEFSKTLTFRKTEDVYNDIADDVEKKLIHQIIKFIDHLPRENKKLD